ncbi:MAG: hypothetical protein IPL59_17205 [Candidatus Competibacteraceae bacterium]|nr:hypothetical protein [Candidatus Competibacteraceae bacterium]
MPLLTLRLGGHVRIDILSRLSPRARECGSTSSGRSLFLLPVCLLIAADSWNFFDRLSGPGKSRRIRVD